MSWLSPKRRRTTGNLKTFSSGQDDSVKNGLSGLPGTPSGLINPRPLSQSNESNKSSSAFPDLFYAYARRGNDTKSRYLLTFASPSVANEWWQQLRSCFHGTSRPSHQLFTFQDPETLEKAWKHPSFDHLKSKWMYISFSDTLSNGLGGAAQKIMPAQESTENMLGGGEIPVLQMAVQKKRDNQKATSDALKLEEYFQRMMERFEDGMEQAVALALNKRRDSAEDKRNSGSDGGYFGSIPDLSEQFERLNDLLTRNAEHVEGLATRQSQQEERLNSALKDGTTGGKGADLNLEKLSSHLDRIQELMEQGAAKRNDIVENGHQQPIAIDFSPLTEKLERVQEAVEQNSALIKALLDEGTAESSKPTTPFWGKEASSSVMNLSPLAEHLEKIHFAIEQQSSHMQALVGFATGDENDSTGQPLLPSPSPMTEKALAPLGEHLEQIYEAIIEGNRHAKESSAKQLLAADVSATDGKFNQLLERLTSLQALSEAQLTHAKKTVEAQDNTRHSEDDDEEVQGSTLADKLDEVNEHLQCLREWTEFDSDQLTQLLETQRNAQEDAKAVSKEEDPLASIRKALEQNTERMKSFLDARPPSVASASSEIDLTPLAERLRRIHESLEKQTVDKSPGMGDSRFLMSALTSHLSKIQAVTEQNAQHIRQIRDKQASSQERMQNALTEAANQIAFLASRQLEQETRVTPSKTAALQQQRFEQRLEATSSQMRELMSGHREMLEVMREVARSLSASDRNCEHIVVPPPRKMGRKIVGFVYDAKDETS